MASRNSSIKHRSFQDISGEPFGLWTIISFDKHQGYKRYWNAVCQCGTIKSIEENSMVRGLSTNCGCIARKSASKRFGTHGMSHTVERSTWMRVIDRCTNPNTKCYVYYGSRSIKMCSGWMLSFESFYADMGKRPEDKTSIHRIDNNKGYTCGHCSECISNGHSLNCRWADSFEQLNNTSRSKFVTFQGETKTLAEWARYAKQNYKLLHKRLANGWDFEKALHTPSHLDKFKTT